MMKRLLILALCACGGFDKPPLSAPTDITATTLTGQTTLKELLVVVTPDTIIVGDSTKSVAQACAFLVLSTGVVAMRSQDAQNCSAVYLRFTAQERKITPSQQRWADAQCIQFRSSDPAVAVVASEACPLV